MLMETVTDENLHKIGNVLAEQPGVLRVILFGSRARGNASEHSDVDLLVICEGAPEKMKTIQRLRRALPRRMFGMDLLVMGEQEFRETRDVVGGLAYPASKYGRVLFDRTA